MLKLTIWALLFFAPPLLLFYYGSSSIMALIIGFFLAYASLPVCKWMEGRRILRYTVSRAFASAVVSILGTLAILFMFALIMPSLLLEIAGIIQNLPAYLKNLGTWLLPIIIQFLNWIETTTGIDVAAVLGWTPNDIRNYLSDFGGANKAIYQQAGSLIRDALVGIKAITSNTFSALITILLIPFSYYFALRWWQTGVQRSKILVAEKLQPMLFAIAKDVDNIAAGYVRGLTLLLIVLSAYYATAFSIIGLDNSLGLGAFTGLISFIPLLGATLSGVLVILIAFLQFNFDWHFFATIGAFLLGQSLENFFLAPRLVGGRVGLHPLVAIFALLLFASWFGIVGLIFALPITAITLLVLRSLLLWTKK